MRLSPATLETLAIVAYRQPVTKAAIERIRGVDSDYTVRTLLHRRLVVELGRAEAPGRPILYGTGFEFLERFGLTSLDELPPLDLDVATRLVDGDGDRRPGPGARRHRDSRPARDAIRPGRLTRCPPSGSRRSSPPPASPRAAARTSWSPPVGSPSTAARPCSASGSIRTSQRIAVDGRAIGAPRPRRAIYLALHKPMGVDLDRPGPARASGRCWTSCRPSSPAAPGSTRSAAWTRIPRG